ncbi:MAG TPA: phytanoyl-CoA dioxygenase family protein [Candidatus Binataceae bacterium]|nr:phytanoyl-CoA dioxygenase family protein [Candidatus Binataceae bacterium]
MSATQPITAGERPAELAEEILGGAGFAILPDAMTRAEAAEARAVAIAEASSSNVAGNSARNDKIKHGSARALLHQGELFERLVQQSRILAVAEQLLGDDLTLSSYSCRIMWPGAIEMGIHVDYPYWAMPEPYLIRPPLMLQVIWMLQDFTETNGATLLMPRSQLLATRPDPQRFRREAIKITGSAGTAVLTHGLLWHDTSPNQTPEPRVSLLINYGNKVIRPLDSEIANVPPEVLARATPKLRQLLGLEFRQSLNRDLSRQKLY